jgi:hypothetical protein
MSSSENDISGISFTKINDKYSRGQYGDSEIIIMNDNNYINATKLCNNAILLTNSKKPFKNWKTNANTNKIIHEISLLTNISMDDLMIYRTTGSKNLTEIRGTYVHPMLITHIAYWVSPIFAVKIGVWIEEWKQYSKKNSLNYYDALSNLVPSNNNNKEKIIQAELQQALDGDIEVHTKAGNIDLLTKNSLIEIKSYDNWKCALGQLMAYSVYYPKKDKYMYLFDVGNNDTKEISQTCAKYDITMVRYN